MLLLYYTSSSGISSYISELNLKRKRFVCFAICVALSTTTVQITTNLHMVVDKAVQIANK